jgi:TolB-like protein
MKKFIEELKRRNVIKASLAYLVISWIIVQVAQAVLPTFGAPDWVLKALIIGLAIGLPIWIIISWIYDITPEGIEKTAKVSENELVTEVTNKRLNVFIIVSLSIAVIFMGLKLSNFFSDSDERYVIAVLPFDNMNVDEDNYWISNGLTKDIRTYLSKIENLTIISERSVKEALDSEKPLPEIAELLNVTYFVGGSMRQFNDDLKINVHLTRTSNDKDLWIENYDRNLDNPLKVQQDISQKIVAELKIQLSPEEEKTLEKFPTKNMEAYKLFVEGHLINDSRKKEDLEKNIELNKQAVALDPNFAEAYTEIGLSTFLLDAYYSDLGWEQWPKKAMPYLDKALQLDPNNAMVYGVKGMIANNAGNWEEAKELFEKAILLNPNNATIRFQYANHAGEHDINISIYQTVIGQKLDPLSPLLGHMYFTNLIKSNKIEEADQYYSKYRFLFTKPGEKLEKESILIAYKNKDWTAAIRFLETELKKDPNNAILNRKLGEAYDGILLDDDNYVKYTKKAYELDASNLDNANQYYSALLSSEKYKEAKILMESENFKSLFNKEHELETLFGYYFAQENYKKAQEVLKDSLMPFKDYYRAGISAQLGDRDLVINFLSGTDLNPLHEAIFYALLKEKDSMFSHLEKVEAMDGQRQPYRSRRYGFRRINGLKEFDPYRKEERFKALLKKNYLPITHWNE